MTHRRFGAVKPWLVGKALLLRCSLPAVVGEALEGLIAQASALLEQPSSRYTLRCAGPTRFPLSSRREGLQEVWRQACEAMIPSKIGVHRNLFPTPVALPP